MGDVWHSKLFIYLGLKPTVEPLETVFTEGEKVMAMEIQTGYWLNQIAVSELMILSAVRSATICMFCCSFELVLQILLIQGHCFVLTYQCWPSVDILVDLTSLHHNHRPKF